VLSLIFVPAMFMMMDDVGRFIWRFGKMLLSHHHDDDADKTPGVPASPAPAPATAVPANPAPAKSLSFWRSK
jgi:hypothetical protein